VAFLDHHADPLMSPATIDVGPSWRAIALRLPTSPGGTPPVPGLPVMGGAEAIAVHVEAAGGARDYFTSPSVFGAKSDEGGSPVRPLGLTDFAIGGPPPPPRPEVH
jgi:hypothetical protein